MDKFEKKLSAHDKAEVNKRSMDKRDKESLGYLKEDSKYYKAYKDKVVELMF